MAFWTVPIAVFTIVGMVVSLKASTAIFTALESTVIGATTVVGASAAAALCFTASVAFLSESEVIVVALWTIPIATVVGTVVSLKASTAIFTALESTVIGATTVVGASAAAALCFTASVAFLSESEVIVVALWTIPIATVVGTVVSIVSFKSAASVVSALVSTVVASSTVSASSVSLFASLLWTDVDFNTDQAWNVEFSIEMSYVSKWCVGVSQDCVNFTDVYTSIAIHND